MWHRSPACGLAGGRSVLRVRWSTSMRLLCQQLCRGKENLADSSMMRSVSVPPRSR